MYVAAACWLYVPAICNISGLSETDEPPAKKMLIKSEITHEDGDSSQNLVVGTGETSQVSDVFGSIDR